MNIGEWERETIIERPEEAPASPEPVREPEKMPSGSTPR